MSLAVHAWPALPLWLSQPRERTWVMAEAPARSFAQVYREHAKFVWRMLRRFGVPEADLDDATHEVFMVAFRRRDSLWGPEYERSWLFGIARRVAQQSHRTVARRPEELGEGPHTDEGPEREVARREQLALARAAIDAIGEKRRMAFVMSELEQMSAPEIARALDIPVNTVYSRVRKARMEFEQAIARLQGGAEEGGRGGEAE